MNRIAILLSVAALSGCTTMTPFRMAQPPAAPFGEIKVGDTVVIGTKHGRTDRVVVAEIAGDALVSRRGDRYTAGDIAEIARKSIDGDVTIVRGVILLTVGLVGVPMAFVVLFGVD